LCAENDGWFVDEQTEFEYVRDDAVDRRPRIREAVEYRRRDQAEDYAHEGQEYHSI
jgi:hypothetical protein